jgi:hypothetical protein
MSGLQCQGQRRSGWFEARGLGFEPGSVSAAMSCTSSNAWLFVEPADGMFIWARFPHVEERPGQVACVVDANEPVRALMPLNCGQCRDYFCKPNMTHKDRTGWLAFLNTVRTECFDQVLALRPLLPAMVRAS